MPAAMFYQRNGYMLGPVAVKPLFSEWHHYVTEMSGINYNNNNSK